MKKKYISKLLFCFSLIVSIFSLNATQVSAGEPNAFGGQLRDGIGNVFIYLDYGNGTVDNPGIGRYEYLIKNAVNNWMYTGYGANPFYASYVSGNNGSHIDIYCYSEDYGWPDFSFKPIAGTSYYRMNGEAFTSFSQLESENWYYNVVEINDTYVRQDWYSNESAQGTFAHELGHCFGFYDNNSDGRSIMSMDSYRDYIPGTNQIYYTVGQMDHDALNKKY